MLCNCLPGGRATIVNPALQHFALVHQHQVRLAAAEDLQKHRLEIRADFLKGLQEHLAGLRVDPVDDLQQLHPGLGQVVVLFCQELMALLGLLVFLNGHQVDRADLVQPPLQGGNLFRDRRPVGRHPAGGHFLRRQGVDLGRAFLGQSDGDAFAADVVQGDLVFFADAVAEILDGHVLLGQFHLCGPAPLLEFGQAAPPPAQGLLRLGDLLLLPGFLPRQFRDLGVDLLALLAQRIHFPPGLRNLPRGPLVALGER